MPAVTSQAPLIEALTHYQTHHRRRFHMPGHMGRFIPPALNDLLSLNYDLTELDGLDVLSEPTGCIVEAQAQMAQAIGAAHTFFLVNGSSVGIQAAMLTALKPGDKVLLPRNVHRSVLSGLILTGANPVWFLPEWLPGWGLWGQVAPEEVTRQLDQHPDIKALILTSPTYEGIGSDIPTIAAICRARNVLLIIDEAHGSLWPYTDRLPQSACTTLADAVIQSIHKTAGSLTQSAAAHLPKGSRMDPHQYQQALNTLQTTSPSYLLLASLDAARTYLTSPEGQYRLDTVLDEVTRLRETFFTLNTPFQLFHPSQADHSYWDPTKLFLRLPGASGEDWGTNLEQTAQLAFESVSPYGTLYQCGIGLEADDIDFFLNAFSAANHLPSLTPKIPESNWLTPIVKMTPRDAFFTEKTTVNKQAATNLISAETVVHCPPGIPVLMPGEQIQPEHIEYLPETLTVVN
ncbi:MAG: aminotransferase class I/II-fold pyridoxal phosphate-dependent enzyme [Vampirovibrio sp.]|nr:aminotransferase class I/II-fold pyridoxal phosphate-dependent enzyme [Vampirovibrio sp.]